MLAVARRYTQIPRILTPLLQSLEAIDELVASTPGVEQYVKALFGSADAAKQCATCCQPLLACCLPSPLAASLSLLLPSAAA